MLANNSNIYLLILAGLGWVISLYFGFFRYRQYVWSRNKVRYDLMFKLDQRRSELAAKLILFCEANTVDEHPQARLRSLLRRYCSLLQQINFYQHEGVFSEAILKHFREAINADLQSIFSHDNELNGLMDKWLKTETNSAGFISTLNLEQYHQ